MGTDVETSQGIWTSLNSAPFCSCPQCVDANNVYGLWRQDICQDLKRESIGGFTRGPKNPLIIVRPLEEQRALTASRFYWTSGSRPYGGRSNARAYEQSTSRSAELNSIIFYEAMVPISKKAALYLPNAFCAKESSRCELKLTLESLYQDTLFISKTNHVNRMFYISITPIENT